MSPIANSLTTASRDRSQLLRLRKYLQAVQDTQREVSLTSLGPGLTTLLAMAAALYVSQAALAVVYGRHLFNDGAWFVVKMLSENHIAIWNTHGWHDFYVGRFGAFAYQEFPTLLASRLHVRNPKTLLRIYGTTLYLFKPLGILLCYHFARDKRLVIFPVLTLFAITMNSEGYVITETHLMTALFWAALFGLMCRREFSSFDLAAVIVVSAPLLLCYETMALYGLILCFACVYRYFAIANSRREKWLCWILFAWYGLSAVFGALAIIYPRDPSNRNGFLQGMFFMLHLNHIGARVSCIVLIICAIVVLIPERYRAVINGLTAIAILCSLEIPLDILQHPERTNFGVQVPARTMNATVTLGLAVAFLLLVFQLLKVGEFQYKRLFLMAAVLGMCQSAWMTVATVQWANMIMVLRSELRTHNGAIPFEGSLLSQWQIDGQPVRTLTAAWAMPALSILYSDRRIVQSMVVPPPDSIYAFDPYSASDLPKLQRFGFDYHPYLAALPAIRTYPLDEWIPFGQQDDTAMQKGSGWWNSEAWGTWSKSDAEITVNLPGAVDSDLLLQTLAGGYVGEKNPDLRVQVLVNDVPAGEWDFHYKPGGKPYEVRDLVIPQHALNRKQPPVFRFLVSGVHSPAELGLGGDPRPLGFALVKLRLVACTEDICRRAGAQSAAAGR